MYQSMGAMDLFPNGEFPDELGFEEREGELNRVQVWRVRG